MSIASATPDRNYSIDLVKFIAMCLVVCLHTTYDYIVPGEINIEYILYNSAVIAVPLFFMVSGYLLIGREDATYRYATRKILGIIRFVFLVVVLWWLVRCIASRSWDVDILLYTLKGVFIQEGPFGVFWYFGAMCILYSVYPLINRLTKIPKYFLTILILIGIMQNLAFSWSLVDIGERGIVQVLRIWNWLFYFMLGGVLKKLTMNKMFLAILIILTGVLNFFVIRLLSPHIGSAHCEYFYGCPVVIVYASLVFILFKEIRISANRLTRMLSSLFLPVYTLHCIIMAILVRFGVDELGGLIFYLAVLSSTIMISWLIMKIPYVNKVFRI
ncbi:MAG: acyltransferase family protein [Muribaculaceae bacterium]|nr:acyltransferase family protein [Muribaculaceae bacterium]